MPISLAVVGIASIITATVSASVAAITLAVLAASYTVGMIIYDAVTGVFTNVVDTLTGLANIFITDAEILMPELPVYLKDFSPELISAGKLLPSELITLGSDVASYIEEADKYSKHTFIPVLKTALGRMNTLSEAARTINYVQQGKYSTAIDEAFNKVLPKINAQVNGAMNNVLTWINGVRSEVNNITNEIYTSIESIDVGLQGVQNDLTSIGDAFHVKVFNEFADAVGSFRSDILDQAAQDVEKVNKRIDSVFSMAEQPYVKGIMTYSDVMSDTYDAAQRRTVLANMFGYTIMKQNKSPGFRLTLSYPKLEDMLANIW